MTKLHKSFVIILTIILLLFITTGANVATFAESDFDESIVTEQTEPDNQDTIISEIPEQGNEQPSEIEQPENETGIDGIAEQFITYLKEKYGADYDYYYNCIIEQWGSVEGYLLAFGNKLPQEYQSDWEKFVGWLNEYAPIWVTALAATLLVIAIIVGKRKIKKLKEWLATLIEKFVNKRLAPIENELNLQSKATVTMLHSQKALFGSSEKFTENVKELDEAERELLNE